LKLNIFALQHQEKEGDWCIKLGRLRLFSIVDTALKRSLSKPLYA
jgi:hypothetical protein